MIPDTALASLGLLALLLPVLASIGMFIPWVLGLPLSEPALRRTTAVTFGSTFLICLAIDARALARSGAAAVVSLAQWMVLPGCVVEAELVFDLPAAVLMTLTALLVGLVGAFSAPYLHQDPGYRRFFVLLPLFATGMMAVAAAHALDLLYAGWEVVGITSALLIPYFHTREAPVRHGLRAFAVYRLCDLALLAAAVLLHHHAGHASPEAAGHPDAGTGRMFALLQVFASMGKAAAFPFSC